MWLSWRHRKVGAGSRVPSSTRPSRLRSLRRSKGQRGRGAGGGGAEEEEAFEGFEGEDEGFEAPFDSKASKASKPPSPSRAEGGLQTLQLKGLQSPPFDLHPSKASKASKASKPRTKPPSSLKPPLREGLRILPGKVPVLRSRVFVGKALERLLPSCFSFCKKWLLTVGSHMLSEPCGNVLFQQPLLPLLAQARKQIRAVPRTIGPVRCGVDPTAILRPERGGGSILAWYALQSEIECTEAGAIVYSVPRKKWGNNAAVSRCQSGRVFRCTLRKKVSLLIPRAYDRLVVALVRAGPCDWKQRATA